MVVADAVLVDILHGEGTGLPVVLAIASAFDGPVARRLDDGEDYVLRLEVKVFVGKKRHKNRFLILKCYDVRCRNDTDA